MRPAGAAPARQPGPPARPGRPARDPIRPGLPRSLTVADRTPGQIRERTDGAPVFGHAAAGVYRWATAAAPTTVRRPRAGPRRAHQTQQMLRTGFPDFHITIEALIAEQDQVVARMRWTGTHHGPFLHLPPSGKAFDSMAIRIYRIAAGKIVESVAVQDRFEMLTQLGVLPGAPPVPDAAREA